MEIACAKCRRPFVKRSRRHGMLDHFLGLAYVYPFRCQVCRHRFHRLQWGIRYIEMEVDRRQYARRPVKLSAHMSADGKQYEGQTIDLAMGGCAADAEGLFLVGSTLSVQLHVPDDAPIQVDVAAVRSVRTGRIGVEFLRCAPAERQRLRRYIEHVWKMRSLAKNSQPTEAGWPVAQPSNPPRQLTHTY